MPPRQIYLSPSEADGVIRRAASGKGYNYLVSRVQRKSGAVYLCAPDRPGHRCGWQVRLHPHETDPTRFKVDEIEAHSAACMKLHNNSKAGELPRDAKEAMEEMAKTEADLTPTQVYERLSARGMPFLQAKISEVWSNMRKAKANKNKAGSASQAAPVVEQEDSSEGEVASSITTVQPAKKSRASGVKRKRVTDEGVQEERAAPKKKTLPPPKPRRSKRMTR